LYNLRHASLRNVVERVFGVVKKRFPGISHGIQYSLEFQVKFIYSVCALHNWINGHRTNKDELYQLAYNDFLSGENRDSDAVPGLNIMSNFSELPSDFAVNKRQIIATELWDQYTTYTRSRH
jgi:hypothetical protein